MSETGFLSDQQARERFAEIVGGKTPHRCTFYRYRRYGVPIPGLGTVKLHAERGFHNSSPRYSPAQVDEFAHKLLALAPPRQEGAVPPVA